MKFKAGDKIEMLYGCSGVRKGETCVVYDSPMFGHEELYAKPEGTFRGTGCHCQYKWKLISQRETITKTKGRIEISC